MACWVRPSRRQRRARCSRLSVAQSKTITGRHSRHSSRQKTLVVIGRSVVVGQVVPGLRTAPGGRGDQYPSQDSKASALRSSRCAQLMPWLSS